MWPRVLIAISAVALVAGTALLLSYLTFLSEARNNVIGALSLVGDIGLGIYDQEGKLVKVTPYGHRFPNRYRLQVHFDFD